MSAYRSPLNEQLISASPAEVSSVNLGPIHLKTPVVLAPMAGVTDWPFRSLCLKWGAALYVNQMITARALVEENSSTWKLAEFGQGEPIRSIQLYGTDPKTVALAVRMLKDRLNIDHLDMNFGCPAPKVTRNGGGAAIPVKRRLLGTIVESAVEAGVHVFVEKPISNVESKLPNILKLADEKNVPKENCLDLIKFFIRKKNEVSIL